MKCRICEVEKPSSDFFKNYNYCKTCHKKRELEVKELKKQGLWENRDVSYRKKPKPWNSKTSYKIENDIEYKLCSVCQKWQTFDNYDKSKRHRDGFFSRCKQCRLEYIKEYQEKYKNTPPPKADPHEIIDGKICKKCKGCFEYKELDLFAKNIDSWDKLRTLCIKCNKIRYSKNNRYRYNNDENYRNKEKERIKQQRRIWQKTRVDYRIRTNLSKRIRLAMLGITKSQSTMNLLGCTLIEFLRYMESLFQDTMSWENYGPEGWHIDHIIPCANFDLTNPDEQKKCFHYTNLQPLWAQDNRRKSAKLDWKPDESI